MNVGGHSRAFALYLAGIVFAQSTDIYDVGITSQVFLPACMDLLPKFGLPAFASLQNGFATDGASPESRKMVHRQSIDERRT